MLSVCMYWPFWLPYFLQSCNIITHASFPPHGKTKSNRRWPGSLLALSEGAFELAHGYACIIGWQSGLLDILTSPLCCTVHGVIISSVVVCLRCLLHHILPLITYTFWENRDFVFIIIAQFMMIANSQICFGLQIIFVCLYITPSPYHHCANLSENIELAKCPSYIFCGVCKIGHILSVIHYTIYGTASFQFTHFPCDDWENIYFVLLSSSNRKYEILFIV